jgi:hypothetical protein
LKAEDASGDSPQKEIMQGNTMSFRFERARSAPCDWAWRVARSRRDQAGARLAKPAWLD